MRIVLLGLPGTGKSVQAAKTSAYYSVPSVSPGALLREAVRQGTEIGRQSAPYLKRGELVPNHLVDLLLFGRLRQPDCREGFVLDGFPRTLEQAESLDAFMRQAGNRLSAVLHLVAPDEVIVARLGARRVCQGCGAIYNLAYNAPRFGDICYMCHTPLSWVGETLQCEGCKVSLKQREDDKPAIVRRRLQIQREALAPVLTHYGDLGLLREIDGAKSPEEVFDQIRAIFGGEERQAGGSRWV